MKTIRVFPRQTSMTPRDDMAFVSDPPLVRPEADEVHISVTFTWDIEAAYRLSQAWGQYYPIVKTGGPALDDHADGFVPGRYIRDGVTFTSRGCNNNCPWCLVPQREGRLRLLPDVAPGTIIQDNNLLQAGQAHLTKVFGMLRRADRRVYFSGGLEAALVDDWVAEELRGLRIRELFLAADTDAALRPLERAVNRLSYLKRNQLRCYVLLAYNGESMERGLARLMRVWEVGCLPFAQLYQPSDHYIDYPQAWRELARTWSRPAATKTLMRSA